MILMDTEFITVLADFAEKALRGAYPTAKVIDLTWLTKYGRS